MLPSYNIYMSGRKESVNLCQNNQQLKSKINFILPIALAIILPGLGFYATEKNVLLDQYGIYGSWMIVSILLYLLWHILWNLWDGNKRYHKRWVISALVLLIMMISIGLYISEFTFKWQLVARMLMASILFLAIQYALRTQQNISRLLVEKEQIQTENYRTQLKALHTKIDPHFLFNSLNTLRSMVRHKHEHSEKFIISLSDFYRQNLKHNENTTLDLAQELSVMQSFLFLMKSRNENAVALNIEIDSDLFSYHLPTLALQSVVENCFKHNSMTARSPLTIGIRNTEDKYIEVTNNIQPKISDADPSGLGLNLLRRRYELMNVQNGLIIHETEDAYVVKLKLI